MLKYLLYLLIIFVYLKANSTSSDLEEMHSEHITPLIQLILDNRNDVSQVQVNADIISKCNKVFGGSEQSPSVLSDKKGMLQTVLKTVKVDLFNHSYQVAYRLKLGSRFFRNDQNQFQLTIYSDDHAGDKIGTYLINTDLTISQITTSYVDVKAIVGAYSQRMEKEGGRLGFIPSMINSIINSIKAKASGLFEQGSAYSSESWKECI